jgi:hypothetical protein
MNTLVRKPTPVNASPLTEEILHDIEKGLWWKNLEFTCKICGQPAYLEKGAGKRLACLECEFVSFNPTLHFECK